MLAGAQPELTKKQRHEPWTLPGVRLAASACPPMSPSAERPCIGALWSPVSPIAGKRAVGEQGPQF